MFSPDPAPQGNTGQGCLRVGGCGGQVCGEPEMPVAGQLDHIWNAVGNHLLDEELLHLRNKHRRDSCRRHQEPGDQQMIQQFPETQPSFPQADPAAQGKGKSPCHPVNIIAKDSNRIPVDFRRPDQVSKHHGEHSFRPYDSTEICEFLQFPEVQEHIGNGRKHDKPYTVIAEQRSKKRRIIDQHVHEQDHGYTDHLFSDFYHSARPC